MSNPAPAVSAFSAEDESHLKLLAIFYYVFAALGALALLMVAALGALVFGMAGLDGHGSAAFGGSDVAVLVVVLLLSAVLSLAGAVLQFMTAQRLRRRRRRNLCQFTAAITCLSFPLGTLLGVFTFIVLARPSVRAAFAD